MFIKIRILTLVIILFSLFTSNATAQVEEIRNRLKEFNITEDRLSSNLKEEDAVLYYKTKSVTGSNSGNVTSIAEYDPRLKSGQRTKLLSVNGEPPTKSEAKKYNKRFGKKGKHISGKIDPDSYKIIRDDKGFLVIGFRLIKESLPDRYQFLGDCDAQLYCRKDIMQVSYGEFISFQPTKVKMFNTEELKIEIYFMYNEESKSYVHEEARYYMKAKLMGVPTELEMINYFSEYKVVK